MNIYAHPGIWKNTDPRIDCSYGCYEIVIIKPTGIGFEIEAGFGFIDTKHDWYIHTSFKDHDRVGADDQWDDAWWWTLAPDRK